MKVILCSLCIGTFKLLKEPIEIGDYTANAKDLIEEKCYMCGEMKYCEECEISDEWKKRKANSIECVDENDEAINTVGWMPADLSMSIHG